MRNFGPGCRVWGVVGGLLIGAALPVHAIDSKAGTGGAAFMKIQAGSPRASALGKAFSAIASGPDAMLYNPAGLAASTQKEVAFAVTDWVQGVRAQTVAYIHPAGRTVFGANVSYMTVSGFDVRDDQGVALSGSHVRVRDAFATASVAHSFLYEKLFLGLSIKEVLENNGGPKRSTVVEDLGAVVRPSQYFAVGASFLNLSNDKKRVVQTQRMGVAFSPSVFLNLTGEISKDSDNASRIGAGAEVVLPEEVLQVGSLALRVGFFETDAQGENRSDSLVKRLSLQRTSGVSLGLGLYSSELTGYGMGMDYALVPMGALGVSHQVMFRMRF